LRRGFFSRNVDERRLEWDASRKKTVGVRFNGTKEIRTMRDAR